MNRNEESFEKIADGLAAESFAVVDDFLSKEIVGEILTLNEFTTGLSEFRKAGIGLQKDIQISVRGDYIKWIDRNEASPALTVYLQKLEALIQYLNQALFLSLKDYEVHMTIYPPGSYYKRHLDQFRGDDHRRLSIICYLNTNWQNENGGQLKLYHPSGTKEILPLAGRLVCFRSDQLEHEVMSADRDRLSITGWILDQFAGLTHL